MIAIWTSGFVTDLGHGLDSDPGELNEIASQHPEITQSLLAALNDAESTGKTRK